MESSQLILTKGQKVRLKLIQPHIKCAGRGDVVCYYRGTILHVTENYALISFKQYGVEVQGVYGLKENSFSDRLLKDIKIIE